MPSHKSEDEERRDQTLTEVALNYEFKKRLWEMLRRWGTWLVAFLLGVTVIRDFVQWAYKLLGGK